jgi:hypothetical protein
VKDQKLKNGRWGRGEQQAPEIYFYRNIPEDLFEISFLYNPLPENRRSKRKQGS